MQSAVSVDIDKSAKTLTTIIYALYAASIVFGITALVAIVMNYVKKNDMDGSLYESHFRWQIRTFWFSLLWSLIGVVTIFFGIGLIILLAGFVWYIYRIVKGWLNLNDNKPMYAA
jgi:uncharacterized membrane protein